MLKSKGRGNNWFYEPSISCRCTGLCGEVMDGMGRSGSSSIIGPQTQAVSSLVLVSSSPESLAPHPQMCSRGGRSAGKDPVPRPAPQRARLVSGWARAVLARGEEGVSV
ncbi:hypothetical protein RRG08_009162 [Elysia crispata]|uniref:Uncharacterized protein n=1 Tax=Elysia crispata TaxID=231223 RepID=A0AAE1B3H3_9GAST|nr:hypothetical protein RRG08_009162 [Elysia crispata]